MGVILLAPINKRTWRGAGNEWQSGGLSEPAERLVRRQGKSFLKHNEEWNDKTRAIYKWAVSYHRIGASWEIGARAKGEGGKAQSWVYGFRWTYAEEIS